MISTNSSKNAEKVISEEISKLRKNVPALRPLKNNATRNYENM